MKWIQEEQLKKQLTTSSLIQESKTLILKLQIAKVSNKKKIKNLRKEVHQEAKADKRVPCPNKSKY